MDQEQIAFEIDERPAVAAAGRANVAIDRYEKGVSAAGAAVNRSFASQGENIVRITDRSRASIERLVASVERQSQAYGKTGVERLVSQRDALIRRLGDEKDAVERVTSAYEKMIKAEEGSPGGKFKEIGESVKQFIESPMQASGKAVTGLLEKVGTMGTVLAVGVTVMAALGAATFEAAKSLGEYGVRIKDVELRTGLSAKEVGQFGYAARAVGQDVSVVERLMRGLTVAIEDNSTQGDRARKTLQSFGVDLVAVKEGAVPTSEVLRQVSEGLNRLPTSWERNKAAIDLFKKAGIDTIPYVLELNEHLKESETLHFASEQDIERYRKYQVQVAAIATEWEHLKLKLQETLVGTVSVVVKWFNSGPGAGGSSDKGQFGDNWYDRTRAFLAGQTLSHPFTAQPPPGLTDIVGDAARAQQALIRPPTDITYPATRSIYLQEHGGLEYAQQIEAQLKQAYDEAIKDVSKTRDQIDQARVAYEHQRDVVKELAKDEAERLKALEKARDLIKEGMSFYRFPTATGAEFVTGSDIFQANQMRTRPSLRTPAEQQRVDEQNIRNVFPLPEGITGAGYGYAFVSPEASRLAPYQAGNAASAAAATESLREDEQLERAIVGYQEEMVRLNAGIESSAQKTSDLRVSAAERARDAAKLDLDTAQQILNIRLHAAQTQQEANLATIDYLKEEAWIQADMDRKHEEEIQRQLDTLQRSAAGLFNTLFTKPQDFGRQLATTVRAAVLQPITQGLGALTSNLLRPLVYGPNGDGGIAGSLKGVFGGGAASSNPLKASTDLNSAVTTQNSAAVAALTAVMAAALGVAAPAVPSIAGAPNVSVPTITAPTLTAPKSGANSDQYRLPSGLINRTGESIDGVPPLPFRATGGGGSVYGFSPATLASMVLPFVAPGIAAAAPSFRAAEGLRPDVISAITYGGIAPPAFTEVDNGAGAVPTMQAALPSTLDLGGIAPPIPLGGAIGSSGAPVGAPMIPFPGLGLGGFPSIPIPGLNVNAGGFEGGPGGSGGGLFGGFGGFNLSALKSNFWNENIYTGPGQAVSASSLGFGGQLAGVLTSPAAGSLMTSIGLPLAMNGLFGQNRGTWGGIGEGTLGGALTGAGIGTMILPGIGTAIGAGIGAAAGFAIGGFEKLLGIESPETKAKQYAKQLYNVNISDQMAKQIVSIAQSKYGGNVQIAVRDPQVRQMLELYAAGTGQGLNGVLSSTTPRAGSLAESGGQLYQQATYLYGRAYAYQSSLPILGGGPVGTWPGGNPTSVTLNVNGQSAADLLEGRIANTVTPSYVQDQFANASDSSYGRTGNSATLQQPGLIVS